MNRGETSNDLRRWLRAPVPSANWVRNHVRPPISRRQAVVTCRSRKTPRHIRWLTTSAESTNKATAFAVTLSHSTSRRERVLKTATYEDVQCG